MSLQLTKGQQRALDMVKDLTNLAGYECAVMEGFAGTGKALAFDQAVQTPNGPIPIEFLRIGDTVIGANGNFGKVTGVFPQGLQQAHRITFRDGTSVECNEDHLWAVWTHKRRQKKTALVVMSLREIVNAGLRFNSGPHKFSIPLCAPVNYEQKSLPVDPYLLGLLIGDGTNLGRTPTLCIPNSEIELVQAAALLLPTGMDVRVNRSPSCPQWRLVDPTEKGNRLTTALRLLGLAGLKSPERYIPTQYLIGSIQQRHALLRGLMDSDGSCSKNRTRFCTHSGRLARDIMTLVQSLGGTAIGKLDNRGAWNVNVKTWEVPFSLRRKISNWRFSYKNPPSRYIVSVVPTRVCEHVCIKVDAPDGLFLTENYIVTHNTTLMGLLPEALRNRVRDVTILTPTGKSAVRVKEATGQQAKTIHRFLYTPISNEKTGDVGFALKKPEELAKHQGHLIVVDEASMVSEELWKDLDEACTRIGDVKVLLVGDPFQLPPVIKEGDVDGGCALDLCETKLRIRLEEVVRQALDSPIIQASIKVRGGCGPMSLVGLLDFKTVDEVPDAALKAWEKGAAVLVHSNQLRHAMNCWIRRKKGLPAGIVAGEPLLVLQNNYTLDRYNGEVVTFNGWQDPDYCRSHAKTFGGSTELMKFGLTSVDGADAILCEDQVMGLLDHVKVYHAQKAAQRGWRDRTGQLEPPYLHANYGYVLTTHKSQGSEWDEVLVIVEPSVRPETEMGRRWVYTAVTRARKNCTIAMVPWKYHEKLI